MAWHVFKSAFASGHNTLLHKRFSDDNDCSDVPKHQMLRFSARGQCLGKLQENFKEALDILQLAEESFQCCKDDLLTYIDNHALLLMDIVW